MADKTNEPRTGKAVLHQDDTVTWWSKVKQDWYRGEHVPPQDLVAMPDDELERVVGHIGVGTDES